MLYTDVWVSMGDSESERGTRVTALTPFRVDDSLMAAAGKDALFLHCLPAPRGEEVTASAIHGRTSWVFQPAENRLHTVGAGLVGLIEGVLGGADAAAAVTAPARAR